jgi:hypothetical protein
MRGPAGFRWFSARNGGRKNFDFLYVPGKFHKGAEQYAGKQNQKKEKT